MTSDLGSWLTFFFQFIYNAMYTVKMPGFNIPVIYFFILASIMVIFVGVIKRILFQPTRGGRNAKKSKGGDG